MEIKKSIGADLERKRTRNFLLSLVGATLLFVGALYIPLSPGYGEAEDDDIDEVIEDLNLNLHKEEDDRIPLLQKPKKETGEIIKEVDKPENTEQELTEPSDKVFEKGIDDAVNDQMSTEAQPPLAVDEKDKPLSWRVVEDLPEFPGGMVEFMKWLTRNLKYPQQARKLKIEGKVTANFIVNKDGTISDLKLQKTCDPLLDNEALRVLQTMPKWKPGEHHGKPCRTMVSIPIVFKL